MSALTILQQHELPQDQGPMVQVVLPDGEREFPFADMALAGDNPATIADDTLKQRVERWLDLRPGTLDRNYKVARPSTGNIMIQRVGVYGKGNMCICGHTRYYHQSGPCIHCNCVGFVSEDSLA